MNHMSKKTIFSAILFILSALFCMPFAADAQTVNFHQPGAGFFGAVTGLPSAQTKKSVTEDSKKEEDALKNENEQEESNHRGNDEEVVSIGQDRVIQENETINGDAVVVGGNLTIYGRVKGDAVCVGGDLVIGPKATVRGDAVNVGGKAQIDPAAYIRGKKVNVSGFPLGFLKKFKGFKHRDHFNLEDTFLGRVLHLVSGVVCLFFMLFMALLLTVFMPRQLEHIEEHLTGDFPRSALVGVAAPILLPFAFVITCIGILFLPFLFLALLLTGLMGYIAFSRALGRKLLGERSAMLQIFVGLLLVQSASLLGDLINLPGGTFSTVAMVLRAIGAVIFVGVSLSGLGAALYSRWGKRTLAQSQAKRKSNGTTEPTTASGV